MNLFWKWNRNARVVGFDLSVMIAFTGGKWDFGLHAGSRGLLLRSNEETPPHVPVLSPDPDKWTRWLTEFLTVYPRSLSDYQTDKQVLQLCTQCVYLHICSSVYVYEREKKDGKLLNGLEFQISSLDRLPRQTRWRRVDFLTGLVMKCIRTETIHTKL